ncbi:hypothetical protein L6E12_13970 [Actinokineospora sp. PR83]|uniref:hypothetical protein n=1 Tax=Actinokineospora sp. PR83 TaxID=2884908 RepID=UPI001F376EDA|nr:hypothetical protein [Actinokineospora sp. PR83]MCG8916898.1 hypothetical protein [Actinokineospora sp. PR83]
MVSPSSAPGSLPAATAAASSSGMSVGGRQTAGKSRVSDERDSYRGRVSYTRGVRGRFARTTDGWASARGPTSDSTARLVRALCDRVRDAPDPRVHHRRGHPARQEGPP